MTGEILLRSVKKDEPIFIDMIEGPYNYNDELKKIIFSRGL